MFSRYALLALALAVGACSDPRLDASSNDAMIKSMDEVRDDLDHEERAVFDQALETITQEYDEAAGGPPTTAEARDERRHLVHGKTAEEVIAEAARVTAAAAEREKLKALAEIKELEARKEAVGASQEGLLKFEVLSARFVLRPREYLGGTEPILEIKVRNSTGHPVMRASFKAALLVPGRASPLARGSFSYFMSGGIQSGEEDTWVVAPNSASVWSELAPPANAVLQVTMEQLDGVNEKALFSTRQFNEDDALRLLELRKIYGATAK